ncbi:hypothetical protein Aduo_017468 [Ancylostoma duodenale]
MAAVSISALLAVYDCPSEKVAFKLAKKCPSATRQIYSHNWNMHKVSSPSMPDEAAADEATKAWWSELKNNGVGEWNIFTPDLFHRGYRGYFNKDGVVKPVIHYVTMAKDVRYKVGCVIHKCDDGKYVHCLSTPTGPGHPVNKPIYQVGEPCKKDSDCRGKFVCSVEEGLCSLS